MKTQIRVIFAFDFGLKHIGLAIGQEVTKSANTFYSISAREGKPDFAKLDLLVEEWKPKLFVVGNPLNMDGTDSEIKKKNDKFSSLIKTRYNIPVECADERLTTKEAMARIGEDKSHLKASKMDKHSVSAQIILESWFREKN